MAKKPENTFIASVHKYLKDTHYEKMYNPYRSGTPDVWYSGKSRDLWVEYKYIPKIPKTKSFVPDLSARQLEWLNNRYAEGRHVAVIVGTPEGAVLYTNGAWNYSLTETGIRENLRTRKEVADWISSEIGVSCSTQSLKQHKPVKPSTKS